MNVLCRKNAVARFAFFVGRLRVELIARGFARAPSLAQDERFRQWWARYMRMSASPGAIDALACMNYEIDIRHILPAIRVPTLLLHAKGDMAVDVHASRYLAKHIGGAKYVELPSYGATRPFLGASSPS